MRDMRSQTRTAKPYALHIPVRARWVVAVVMSIGCSTPTDAEPDPVTPTPANEPPTVAAIADLETEEGTPIDVVVSITDEDPGTVVLEASSSNATVIGVDGLDFGGSGMTRTLSLSPTAGQSGVSTISVTATDAANQSASIAFDLTVNSVQPPAAFSFLERLEAADGDDSSEFGYAVDVWDDFMVVGTNDSFESGTTYVFRRDQGTWAEVWREKRPGPFGFKVAMEGEYLASTNIGRTYVFAKDAPAGESWSVVDSVDFGWTLAMSGDRILVTDGGLDARILTRDGNSWPVTASFSPGPYDASSLWGPSAAIDGDVAVIGAPADDERGADAGAAFVYRFNGTSWESDGKLTADDASPGDFFGRSVAVSGDRLVVGAPFGGPDPADGSVYVFDYDGDRWIQSARLLHSRGRFGFSVDVSGDEILAGAPIAGDRGVGYHYTRSGSEWVVAPLSIVSSGPGNRQMGYSVAFDGATAVLGTPGDDGQAVNAGAVFVWTR